MENLLLALVIVEIIDRLFYRIKALEKFYVELNRSNISDYIDRLEQLYEAEPKGVINMENEYRARYIKKIAHILKSKPKHPTGCLVVGDKIESIVFQKELMDMLQDENTLVAHVDFNEYKNATECIAALKNTRKHLISNKQEGRKLFLVISSFECVEKKMMDAAKVLIASWSASINILVSANKRFAYLVGLTEYMVTIEPSETVYSELYRYKTQQVIASMYNENLTKKLK